MRVNPHDAACVCPQCVRLFVDSCYEVIARNYQQREPRKYDERFAQRVLP
jgi:hypothetical protein